MASQLKRLIDKLGSGLRGALEGAAGLCVAQGHHEVEVEHLLRKLAEQDGGDLALILRHSGVDRGRLQADLDRSLAALAGGNRRTPAMSPRILRLLERAWLAASLESGAARIRSGHVLMALLGDSEAMRVLGDSVRELSLVRREEVIERFGALTRGSSELEAVAAPAQGDAQEAGEAAGTALGRYTVDLGARAAAGRIDPVLGRDAEIRQMVDILIRRRQNNPILTGEAGVGKTAVVEGLALRIHQGDVPPPLREVVIRALDLGLLQAGAGVKGEFEQRLKAVIDEVKASPRPVILFIDEAHTLIGAGGKEGQGDAANMLKPALARGELRTIAATTWSEYKRYFEKDAALARRFQLVRIEEPDESRAVLMLRGLADAMERHHAVRVLDEAVQAAVRLSARYLSGRQLPDKAVSVLDTACARVAMSQSAMPAAVEDLRRRIEALDREIAVLTREAATTDSPPERLLEAVAEIAAARAEMVPLEERWQTELELGLRLRDMRARLESGEGGAAAQTGLRQEFAKARAEVDRLQAEHALVHQAVDGEAVALVISGWTGIPTGKMMRDEIEGVLGLEERLEERVVGQPHALAAVAKRISTARAGLDDPAKPIGVFLFVGPSGVGKTETALALADLLYGGERNLITLNMSEFQEAHSVATLKGSPPGYVGYGEGGVLTEAVRRRPYSVVLLDEIEKAHPDVLELFFQVFDKGRLDDAEGRSIDFKNTVLILTSNVGTEVIMRACQGGARPEPDSLLEQLRPALQRAFKPAFLGRTIVVPYYPVRDSVLERIVELKLGRIEERVRASHRAAFVWDPAVVQAIALRCTEVDSGARNVDAIVSGTLLPEIAGAVLARMVEGTPLGRIRLGLDAEGGFAFDLG
jgi:type VI secretion system protein VasG